MIPIQQKKQLIIFCLIILCLAAGCTEEFRPQKIKLAAEETAIDSTALSEDEPEGPELAVSEVLQAGNRPVFLFLPVESEIEGAYSNWLKTSITEVCSYLFGQYSDLKVFPEKYVSRIIESENIEEDAYDEVLSILLNNEQIHYYIRSYLTENSGTMLFRYSLHDAKSHASLFESQSTFSEVNEIVHSLNSMTVDIHNLLYSYESSEFVPVNTSYKALHSYVSGEKAAELLDFQSALFYYIECLREDPAFARAYLKTASLYFFHYTDLYASSAEPFLQNAYRYYDQFSEHDRMLFSAYRNYYFRKYDESYMVFRSMMNYFPESSYGYSGALRVLLTMNNPIEGQKFIDEWAKRLELDITFLRLSSETYNRLGYFDRSLEKIRVYQSLSNQSIVALLDEAHLLYKWGRTNEALSILDRTLATDRRNFSALSLKGDLYFDRMEYGLSSEALNRAMQVLPPERSAEEDKLTQKLYLADVYAGKYNAAKSIAKRLINAGYRDSNFKNVVKYISELALLEEDYSGKNSITHALSSLIRVQPPDFVHQRMLLLAEVKSNNPRLVEINAKLLQALKMSSEEKYAYFAGLKEAYTAWYKDDYTNAVEFLENSLEYDFNAIVAYHLCRAYMETDQTKKAEELISRFYSNINLYDFETAYILPRYYMIQAELMESRGLLAEAGQLYNNLSRMWSSADELPLKTKILEKIMTINSN